MNRKSSKKYELIAQNNEKINSRKREMQNFQAKTQLLKIKYLEKQGEMESVRASIQLREHYSVELVAYYKKFFSEMEEIQEDFI